VKKYINNSCNPDDLKKVFSLLSTTEGERIFRELMANRNENVTGGNMDSASKENMYARILNSISENDKRKRLPLAIRTLKYAAVISLLMTSTMVVFLISEKKAFNLFKPDRQEISNPENKRVHVVLSDGTEVWLNQKSTLSYPKRFYGKTRDVKLIGEAYFEVAKDSRRPFCISSGEIKTTVLGTSFNISNHPNNRYATISLLTGRIKVEKGDSAIDLKPGLEIVLNKENNTNMVKGFDPEVITAWVENKILLRNCRLDSALVQISEWYNTPIILMNPGDDQHRVTSTFQNQDLGNVLNSLSYFMGFEYETRNDTIWIDNMDEH
jgi:transmembrane sensor